MFDVEMKDFVDLMLQVNVARLSVIEAANPRHEHEWWVWENVKLPPGKSVDPGLDQPRDQHFSLNTPELVAQRDQAVRQSWSGARMSWPERIAASHRPFARQFASDYHVGEAADRQRRARGSPARTYGAVLGSVKLV